MNNNTPTTDLRRCAGGRSDRRGSAILLVLVAMVLMAILAGSLLQLTRFERIPRAESNIEVVIASVIDEILNQATEDLIDDTGLFMNTANVPGGFDEPYDYPWTNGSIAGDRRPENNNGVVQTNILGGRYDDTWLAAHMPVYASAADAVGTWEKITSLTGIWLGGVGGSADLSGVASPNEYNHSSLTVAVNSDTNLATNSGLLVDADGDGIGDSRWEWAPLRQVGATQYVMAVRIVDLSARADMNVAMGSTPSPGTGGITLSTEDPFGDGPTELDGGAFFSLLANTAGSGVALANARTEWRKSMEFRLTGNTAATGAFPVYDYDGNNVTPAAASRRDFWTQGASRTSNTFARNEDATLGAGLDYSSGATFGLTDAFELLQGNGLNSDNDTTIEDLMDTLLRQGGQENGYAAGAGTPPNSWTQRQFWELDPRKHITMYSGSSSAAKPIATGQARALKLDVNRAIATGNLTVLRDRILAVLNTNAPAWNTVYPHLSSTTGVADQLTANIADYIDDDNQLTEFGTATGFEALPYITEIYTQRHYASVANAANPPGDVTWDADGAQGYVIEIGNPFALDTTGAGRPVSLDNIWIDMNGTTYPLRGGTVITGVPAELAAGEVLLLYLDSGGPAGLASLQNYDTATGANNLNTDGSFTTVHRAEGPPMNGTATTQTIGLQAEIQGAAGTAAGWNYSACEIELAGPSITRTSAAGLAGGPGLFSYVQTHYAGHGVGLRMMTVTKGGGTNDYIADATILTDPSENCDVAGGGAARRTIPSTLANETKASSPTGFGGLANDQIVWPDSERERLHWVGDILQIPLIGPRANAAADDEMAAAFSAAGGTNLANGMDDLLLPYAFGTSSISGGTLGTLNYPHALLLLEQLTTFNPATDGEDGDGQSDTESFASPDDDEVLVPGKLNINTAPRETLVRLLPFPDLATRQAIADEIIIQRRLLKNFGGNAPAAPGIPYTSAMYQPIEALGVNPSQLGGDNATLGPDGVQIDLNNHEDPIGTYSGTGTDGVANDREEEIMLAKWLTEMTDTRSDVFAAYIVVQGYPADGFTAGATESARLIIIFSRANVKESGDKAVEIDRFRIN